MIIMPVDITPDKFMVIADVDRLPTILGRRPGIKVKELLWINYDLQYMKSKSVSNIIHNLESDYYTVDDILTEREALSKLFKQDDRV